MATNNSINNPVTGTNTGDETTATIKSKLSITTLSGSNTGDQTTTAGLTNTTDKNLVTDAEKIVIGNTSGANTGDNSANTKYKEVVHSSKTSGVTTTGANITPVDVSGAVFTYDINSVYRIWVMGRLNSAAATTGASMHFNLSTTVVSIDVIGINTLAAAGTVTGFSSIADDVSQSVSSGVPAGPLDAPIIANGLLITNANTGTAQLRLRSETTAVTELLAGVVMVVEKIL